MISANHANRFGTISGEERRVVYNYKVEVASKVVEVSM